MPSNDDIFRIGNYEYSRSNGEYYRWKVGEYVPGTHSRIERSIQKRTFFANYQKAFGKAPDVAQYDRLGRKISARQHGALSDTWKKQLWSRSDWGRRPWNNGGNRIQEHLKPLTINDRNPTYSRIKTNAGRTHSLWGAKLSNGQYRKAAFVLKGTQELKKHLQIAKYQIKVQAEHFRIVVGQRALRVFQLAFKSHRFYNEDTNWKELAQYTQQKRRVAGTWYGTVKSKLYETGAMSNALDFKMGKGTSITRISTKEPNTRRKRISVRDVVKGVPVKGRQTYTTNYIYAGIHNEGVPKGNKPGSKIPKRQFMGWSNLRSHSMDKIDSFAYEVADRFLFDSVFLTKKG